MTFPFICHCGCFLLSRAIDHYPTKLGFWVLDGIDTGRD
jgi:hypothetical protein